MRSAVSLTTFDNAVYNNSMSNTPLIKKPPSPTGRHPELTPELQERIISYIKEGNYVRVACQACGISHVEYYHWLKLAETDATEGVESLYTRFANAVKKAEAESEEKIVALILKAVPKNWIAGMTYLERRFPDRWARRDRPPEDSDVVRKGVELLQMLRQLGAQAPVALPQGEIVEGEVVRDEGV